MATFDFTLGAGSDDVQQVSDALSDICITDKGSTCASSSLNDEKSSSFVVSDPDGCDRREIVETVKSNPSRASSSSTTSDESIYRSKFFDGSNKPHKANDTRWDTIQTMCMQGCTLGLNHFRLLKRLGRGDIGSVYLAEFSGTKCYFAMKVMDKGILASRKKLSRAQTEKDILELLDHPFLPTLYAHIETEKYLCLVMEYCPGGNLHTIRQQQPGRHFSESAARFYAAEILMGLEYLHMLGIIYRDLKPENVLVREDGHIMLADFDLSLRCVVSPTLVKSTHVGQNAVSCVQPTCVQPSCVQPSCLGPRSWGVKLNKRIKKPKNEIGDQELPVLIAEPTDAKSMSFVGTHEYLAPEIIRGEGHGSAVDWWTFGILLYELLFGKTPFKGPGNRATLLNVVGKPLRFPEAPVIDLYARDLIRGLLTKDPKRRLGAKRGATEIKQHPFFEGVNWALIRCMNPPYIPVEENASDLAGEKKVEDASQFLDFKFF